MSTNSVFSRIKSKYLNSTILRQLEKVIAILTEPSSFLDDIVDRSRARLLSFLLIPFLILATLSIVVQYFTVPGFKRILPTLLLSLFVLAVAYSLSRTRYYRLGAHITIWTPIIAVFANLLVDPTNPDTYYYVILSILLGSVLLSWRWTVGIAVVILLITVGYILFIPDIQFSRLGTPIGYVLLITGLILVIVRYRDALELSRRAELIVNENRWRMLIDQSPFSTVIYSPDGRPKIYNEAATKLWGVSPQDLEYIFSDYNLLEDQQLAQKGVLSYIRQGFSGQATVAPASRYEFKHIGEEDSGSSEERWIVAHCYPVKDESGQVHEVVLIHEDITDRKLAEEALKKSEIYFRSLIENAMDIIAVLNVDGTIRFENQAIERILGYQQDELLGESALQYIHPDDLYETRQVFSELVVVRGPTSPIELRFRHKDGSWRHLEIVGNNLIEEPVVAGVIINSRDITERKQAEEVIKRQERLSAVGQMAAGIAHDFNNVMAVITLLSDILLKSPHLDEKERQQVETIRQQGYRAADLTNQILDFSRQSVMERRPIDLIPFVNELIKLLRRTLPENIKIHFLAEEKRSRILADLTRIQQVIMNLALNARDALPRGGDLRIRTGRETFDLENPPPVSAMDWGEWVVLEVADNGLGMPADVTDHIFEPFFTTKGPGGGTGLGLAQVYGIVKQHDGYIDVKTRPGEGSTFTIYFPSLDGLGSKEFQAANYDSLARGSEEYVLVVEDEPATRMALSDSLDLLNYRTETAANGREALSILEKSPGKYALIISDVIMPEMGGIEMFRALKKRGVKIPILMVTGHILEETIDLLRAEGLAEWLTKPVNLEQLSQTVARLLREHQPEDV